MHRITLGGAALVLRFVVGQPGQRRTPGEQAGAFTPTPVAAGDKRRSFRLVLGAVQRGKPAASGDIAADLLVEIGDLRVSTRKLLLNSAHDKALTCETETVSGNGEQRVHTSARARLRLTSPGETRYC
jgi:hypothetical protein